MQQRRDRVDLRPRGGVVRVRPHHGGGVVQAMQLGRRLGDAAAGRGDRVGAERRSARIDPPGGERLRHPAGTAAERVGVDEAAGGVHERADAVPRPLEPLAVRDRGGLEDPRRVGRRELEDVAEHERDPLAAFQALQHRLGAGQPHLLGEHHRLGSAVVRVGQTVGQAGTEFVQAELLRLLRGLPPKVEQVVDADPVRPGEEPRLSAPGRQPGHHPDQDFLGRVLGVGRPPRHPQR